MYTWKINELNGPFEVALYLTHVLFHRDTRIVGHLLPEAGQAVKKRCLPGVGWPNKCDQGRASFILLLSTSVNTAFRWGAEVTQRIGDLLALLREVTQEPHTQTVSSLTPKSQ